MVLSQCWRSSVLKGKSEAITKLDFFSILEMRIAGKWIAESAFFGNRHFSSLFRENFSE